MYLQIPGGEDRATYCDKMEQESEKADHVAVFAMARALEMDIFIVTCQEENRKFMTVVGAENFTGQTLLLAHDDDEKGYGLSLRRPKGEYRSLVPYKGMYAPL